MKKSNLGYRSTRHVSTHLYKYSCEQTVK